jgi:hypothetical protein
MFGGVSFIEFQKRSTLVLDHRPPAAATVSGTYFEIYLLKFIYRHNVTKPRDAHIFCWLLA